MLWFPKQTALIVIDVQQGFNAPAWGPRNNPDAERNISRLLQAFRDQARTVVHVHHTSVTPTGFFRTECQGHVVKPEAAPLAGEPLYFKTVNSAFIGTTLEYDLRTAGIEAVVIVGLSTNHCISTSVRMAGNLGFSTFVVSDATAAFDRIGIDGVMRAAEDVHIGALSDLSGEFARVTTTEEILMVLNHLPATHLDEAASCPA